jgi:hypothetical protein
MQHPHSVSLTQDEIDQLKHRATYLQMYRILRRGNFGIEVFEPDGKSDGRSGVYYLERMLAFFEAEESYEKCIHLHNWIKEFRERWPELC